MDDKLHTDEAFVCTYENTARLTTGATGLRIVTDSKDYDETLQKQLRQLGFTIVNQDVFIEQQYGIGILLVKVEYGMLLAACCLLAGVLIFIRELQ